MLLKIVGKVMLGNAYVIYISQSVGRKVASCVPACPLKSQCDSETFRNA